MRGDLVYVTTPDAYLDARDGAVRWTVEIADSRRGYWSTNAPLVIRNHVIAGVSGDFDNLPGVLQAFDPIRGARQWTFYSTPPGTPGRRATPPTRASAWCAPTEPSPPVRAGPGPRHARAPTAAPGGPSTST